MDRKAAGLGLCLCLPFLVSDLALARDAARLEQGTASLRMDREGRIALVLDRAPADGRADLVVLCAPYEVVPGGLPGARVAGSLRLEEGRVSFVSDDATLHVQLAVDPLRRPDPGTASSRRGGEVRVDGSALGVYERDFGVPPEDVETELIEVVAPPRESGGNQPNVDCTDGRPDDDCLSGRLGATQTSQTCGGVAAIFGAGSCSVTCGPGTYACGKCGWGGFAQCTCRQNFTCHPHLP